MTSVFDTYLADLAATPLDQHTEHTGRSALETLLKSFAAAAASPGLNVQHEPKRQGRLGSPDFKVTASGQVLGYVEVKPVSTPLDDVLRGEQIAKYKALSGNILLTDYLEWIWLRDGRVNGRVTLAYPTDLAARTVRARADRADEVAQLVARFFSVPPAGIGRARDLAAALAVRAPPAPRRSHRGAPPPGEGPPPGQALRPCCKPSASRSSTTSRSRCSPTASSSPSSTPARARSCVSTTPSASSPAPSRSSASSSISSTSSTSPTTTACAGSSTRSSRIVNSLDLDAIHEDLSFRQRKAISRKVRAKDADEHRLFERDPFIYFYVDFLKATTRRCARGAAPATPRRRW